MRQTFDKVSMGSDFPIVGIDVVAGLKEYIERGLRVLPSGIVRET